MSISSAELKTLLVGSNLVDSAAFEDAQKLAETEKKFVGDIVVDKGLIGEEQLAQVIANFLTIPYVDLSQQSIADDILNIIPQVVAKKQRIISFKKDASGLHLAMLDPTDMQTKEFLQKKTGLPVVAYITSKSSVKNALILYNKNVEKAFEEIIAENVNAAQGTPGAEPPIIKIVDAIITYAYQNKASDIHIEAWKHQSVVRYRIDGVLHDIVTLPLELYPRVVTRVKILSSLPTDEHQAAQDAKISYETEDGELDLRVSIVPVVDGEKIVMRLLSASSRRLTLSDLGLSESDQKKAEEAYKKPHGMILVTGPTGSGKTTTLYAILKVLNTRDVNIMTIEDPVEYDIRGINQIQVNEVSELTFAKGLRTIVRQDPDVILVGEIRDDETADIAVNSAMTGHLVLSTLHTNDAATTFPRLMDMNVEPYLIASSINVVIAQRLVRSICVSCRASVEVKRADLEKQFSAELISKMFGNDEVLRFYAGKGCSICHDTGYAGRIGTFEVLILDEEIKKAIVDRSDADLINEIAIKNGMTPMIEDGLDKVKKGLTTIDEVIRVTMENASKKSPDDVQAPASSPTPEAIAPAAPVPQPESEQKPSTDQTPPPSSNF